MNGWPASSRTTSRAREFSRQGLDWEDELRQIAKEEQFMRELGLAETQSEPAEEATARFAEEIAEMVIEALEGRR